MCQLCTSKRTIHQCTEAKGTFYFSGAFLGRPRGLIEVSRPSSAAVSIAHTVEPNGVPREILFRTLACYAAPIGRLTSTTHGAGSSASGTGSNGT